MADETLQAEHNSAKREKRNAYMREYRRKNKDAVNEYKRCWRKGLPAPKRERRPRKPGLQAQALAAGLDKYFTGKPCKNGHIAPRYTKCGNCVECQSGHSTRWGKDNREKNNERAVAYYHNRTKIVAHEQFKSWGRNRRARDRNAEGFHTADHVRAIRKAQKDRCAYCRSPLAGLGHVDHIIALSRGGSNWPRNLQLLCEPCNLSKHARDPVEFAQSVGLLV